MANKLAVKKVSRKAEIREENTLHIISVAEKVFAEKGFGGATTQEIADRAGLPKANIYYYFPSKEDLYLAVLQDTLEIWKHDADIFDQYEDAKTTLSAYIERKLDHSFLRPYASKVWANEMIQGAPVLSEHIRKDLIIWTRRKTKQIKHWIDKGEILPVDPQNLLYMIWATTQHYADFSYQIKVLNGNKVLNPVQRKAVLRDVNNIILRGLGIEL